jgi:hypothetical protein
LNQAVTLAVHRQNMDMVGQTIEKRSGQSFRTQRLMMPSFLIAWYAIGAAANDRVARL